MRKDIRRDENRTEEQERRQQGETITEQRNRRKDNRGDNNRTEEQEKVQQGRR
jgi:hypothetical protein